MKITEGNIIAVLLATLLRILSIAFFRPPSPTRRWQRFTPSGLQSSRRRESSVKR